MFALRKATRGERLHQERLLLLLQEKQGNNWTIGAREVEFG